MEEVTRTLDLGSGAEPKNPYGANEVYGIEIAETTLPNIMRADIILDGLPYPDNYFDYVTATDFLEHLPRLLYVPGDDGRPVRTVPFIECMSHIWRVLKPNGVFVGKTPAFPRAEAFQDPTHVNIITENTIQYFIEPGGGLMTAYEFKGRYELAAPQYWEGFWLVWQLRAIK